MSTVSAPNKDSLFREFFEAESTALARLGTFMTGDPERGADLAQEALARTYRHWGRIQDAPGAYTRRILVNLIRSQHRHALVTRRHPQLAPDPVESPARKVDDWIVVSNALARLSPIRRAVVILRFYEDLPEREIAEVLDRPLGTVKSDLHRALAQLRPLLGEAHSPVEHGPSAAVMRLHQTEGVSDASV